MLVNYEVPTSSYASESEDISREIGALRRACISLASIPPKQAQRDEGLNGVVAFTVIG